MRRFVINAYVVFNNIFLKSVEYFFKFRWLKRAVSALDNPVAVRREKPDFQTVSIFFNGKLSLVAVARPSLRGDYVFGSNVNTADSFK